LDARTGPKFQHRPAIEFGQTNTACRDVLAKVAGSDAKSEGVELKDQFLFHQMYLPQIRTVGFFRLVVQVLDRRAPVRVAFYAEAFDQGDRSADLFAKAVPARRGDRGDQRNVARRLFFYRVDAGHVDSGHALFSF